MGHDLFWASDEEKLRECLRQADPEVVFSIKHSEFPGWIHAKAIRRTSVRWFHIGGSGWDHLLPWDPSVVVVTNSAGDLAPFHAERAMAALLYLSTGISEQVKSRQAKLWQPTRFSTLKGKRMLVVGHGRTGSELARRAAAFGMRVIAVNRTLKPKDAWVERCCRFDELSTLWSQADVLSLNVPLDDMTLGLVGREQLALLPKGAFLLNASRGGVLEEQPLLDALDSGHLAGAWLDVASEEPVAENSPLWTHPRLLLTPHCADQVADFPLRFARSFVENFRRFEAGKPLLRVVEP